MGHVVRFDDAARFVPGGHTGVLNQMLAGRAEGNVDGVSVWHGEFEPGGEAALHIHDEATQIYIPLSGVFVTGGVDESLELRPLDAYVIPPGEQHFIVNRSDQRATLLVISSPALR